MRQSNGPKFMKSEIVFFQFIFLKGKIFWSAVPTPCKRCAVRQKDIMLPNQSWTFFFWLWGHPHTDRGLNPYCANSEQFLPIHSAPRKLASDTLVLWTFVVWHKKWKLGSFRNWKPNYKTVSKTAHPKWKPNAIGSAGPELLFGNWNMVLINNRQSLVHALLKRNTALHRMTHDISAEENNTICHAEWH